MGERLAREYEKQAGFGSTPELDSISRYISSVGVVWLAFEDLMPSQQRLTIAKRAVSWADSTVELEQLKK